MRLLLVTILICTWLLTGLLLLDRLPVKWPFRTAASSGSETDVSSRAASSTDRLMTPDDAVAASTPYPLELELYEDLDYGFSLAVPSGWTRIVAADTASEPTDTKPPTESMGNVAEVGNDHSSASLEPGYAVGFEAGESAGTGFTDYILIEILPGGQSGLFDADPTRRKQIIVDGRSADFDRLEIAGTRTEADDLALLVLQAELSGIGYTVGLYAIGALQNEHLLSLVFEAMVQTFDMRQEPFTVG